jgi:hypothetical protein
LKVCRARNLRGWDAFQHYSARNNPGTPPKWALQAPNDANDLYRSRISDPTVATAIDDLRGIMYGKVSKPIVKNLCTVL